MADPPANVERYRQCWRMRSSTIAERADKASDDEADALPYPFKSCPNCDRRNPSNVLDLAIRGERPFANLVQAAFSALPPTKPASRHHPNGGRKLLIFADGRQKAARLARDLPREVERDTFRQVLACAVHRLQQLHFEPKPDNSLYTAFVAIWRELDLYFFDHADNSQEIFLNALQKFEAQFDNDLALALSAANPLDDSPSLYREHLLYQLSDQFFNLYDVGVMVAKPARLAMLRIKTAVAQKPELAPFQSELLEIATFWIQSMLSKGAFDESLSAHIRQRVLGLENAPTFGEILLDEHFQEVEKQQVKHLNQIFYEIFTKNKEGFLYLKPEALTLAVDEVWYRCQTCGNIQHVPLFGRCLARRAPQLVACPPTDPTLAARLDYFRQPVREALRGKAPRHIYAEEHTAQLSHRDAGAIYATTEEFELRFQDIVLDPQHPPVDVLSCTTTMEVGIDIGSLQAIGLRNVPPQRTNYQQRAGRAGRRSAAIALVTTYAEHNSHDQHYYYYPEQMIAGDPRLPYLSLDRPRLAQRHINAFLIQTFFQQQEIHAARRNLFSVLGTCKEFFLTEAQEYSFEAFRRWIDQHVYVRESPLLQQIADWLPESMLTQAEEEAWAFVQSAARKLIDDLQQLKQQVIKHKRENAYLLETLFDAGLLPSYAFPKDVVSCYVFDRETGDIKEQPQLRKWQALSEYAPGRLLVINKETYRVGGGYHPYAEGKPFSAQLQRYTYCPACSYVRLDANNTPLKQCPVCQRQGLKQYPMLDPDGFSPEAGLPVRKHDTSQELSYANDIQLPLPVEPERLRWRSGAGKRLQMAYAEDQQFVVVNAGPDQRGFRVCKACGAAAQAKTGLSSAHLRPYPTPSGNQDHELVTVRNTQSI